MKSQIINELNQSKDVLEKFLSNEENITNIEAAARLMANRILAGGKIIACGNGGSHCDAMHFAEEMTGRFRGDRKPLPAIAISDPSHITCTANDYGFESIFSRFIEGLGKENDVLLVISTSGNSSNIINAAKTASNQKMEVVALTGYNGGKLSSLADVEVNVAFEGYSDRVQEMHIKIIHIFIQLIEELVNHNNTVT